MEQQKELDRDLETRVTAFGHAQLLFDDYGSAIRRSKGGALHSSLYRMLVDGKHARDVGALLTSRLGDDLDLRFAGSPLLSRARVVRAPLLGIEDADAVGMSLEQVRLLVGSGTALARRLGSASDEARAYEVVEYLKVDAARIVDDLPPDAVEVLAGARAYQDADSTSQHALLALGSVSSDGSFQLAQVVAESALCDSVQARSPGWPTTRSESVQAFAELLAGVDDAIWVDRYLFADVPLLQSFLTDVRSLTRCRLRLLGSDDRDQFGLASRVAQEINTIEGVDARMMTLVDRRELHDRHLVLPANRTGWVLPTAGVVLAKDAPGSAVVVRMPGLAVDYSQYWRRANRLE